jgi:hypothetical protein
LEELLWDEVRETPEIVILVHSEYGKLTVGLGGEWAIVPAEPERGKTTFVALAPSVVADDNVMFTRHSHPDVYWPENLLKPGDAIEIVRCFWRTGQLADWVSWGPRVKRTYPREW